MTPPALALADECKDRGRKDEPESPGMVLAESGAGGPVTHVRLVRSGTRFPLWGIDAHGEKVALNRALLLTLEEEDGEGVLLGSPELRMWGIGNDVFAALQDFADTFVSVLRSYENTPPAELAPDAADYLGTLQGLVARREAIQGA